MRMCHNGPVHIILCEKAWSAALASAPIGRQSPLSSTRELVQPLVGSIGRHAALRWPRMVKQRHPCPQRAELAGTKLRPPGGDPSIFRHAEPASSSLSVRSPQGTLRRSQDGRLLDTGDRHSCLSPFQRGWSLPTVPLSQLSNRRPPSRNSLVHARR